MHSKSAFIVEITRLNNIFYRYDVYDTIITYTFWFNIGDALKV